MNELPNIVLVMTDQQRWDAVGCAERFPVDTPALDRLARDGAWFPNTHCQGPLCVPSRMSFISGRYVHQTGCVHNSAILWPEAPSFVRTLRDTGYHTANIGKLHYTWQHDLEILASQHLLHRLGFDAPFETTGKMSRGNLRASAYSEHLRQKGLLERFHQDLLHRVQNTPLRAYDDRPSMLDEEDHLDSWVLNRAADWIEHSDERPFFLWVGPEGPHDPFDPSEPYASMYRPDDMPPALLDDADPATAGASGGQVPDATPRLTQEMRTQYLGNVTQIDAGVGRILAALETTGKLDNTWVFFTSDHGEMLGDHRLLWKSQFYEQATRVPLLVRPPTNLSAQRGVVSDALVELLDVPATILGAAGVSMPGHRGRDLGPAVLGEPAGRHRDFVVNEHNGRTMIRTEEWKLVVDDDTSQPRFLWNLHDNPDESTNLVDEPGVKQVVETLSEDVRAFRADTPSDLPDPWFHDTPYRRWGRNPLREYS